MKNLRRIIAVLLAAAMTMALSVSALADEVNNNGTASGTTSGTTSEATGRITINPPKNTYATASNAYKIYKVFDASGDGSGKDGKISYRLVEGKTEAPKGFAVDKAGNVSYEGTSKDGTLTPEDIEAIKAYVTKSDLVDTVEAEGSAPVSSNLLATGYYYITTTTGTVVTIDSTNPNATVEDKNSVPKLNKKITGASSWDENGKKALAQIGTEVSYEAEIIVGKGAKEYVFHDKMDERLSYKGNAKVLKVTEEEEEVVDPLNYISEEGGTDEEDTLKISFKDEYISTLDAGTKLVIRYSGTITAAALTNDPAKNTAYVSYSDKNSNNRTPVSETETYNAQFTIIKQNEKNELLAGAGFVIAREETAEETAETAEEIAENAEENDSTARIRYYKLTGNTVEWVTDINEATEHVSDSKGMVPAFTGLANGTYTVIEKTVPAGYNKAEDSTFTIAEHDYTQTNLEKEATVINKAGVVLPHTGGIGTTIFNIIGTILVIGAGVMLVARRRMEII